MSSKSLALFAAMAALGVSSESALDLRWNDPVVSELARRLQADAERRVVAKAQAKRERRAARSR